MNTARLRGKLKLTQAEFATLFGVHPITVSKWERELAKPTPWQTALMVTVENGAFDVKERLPCFGVAKTLAHLLWNGCE